MMRSSYHPILLLMIPFLGYLLGGCKKTETSPSSDPQDIDPAAQYSALGFTHLARLTTYTPKERFTNPGFFILPKDLRKVNGILKAAWNIEEYTMSMPQGRILSYFGSIEGGKFNPQEFTPCGDPSINSDYTRVIHYEIDGQGNLFTQYRWHDIHSAALTWNHSFCSSTGVTSGEDWVEYPVEMAENNNLVTGIGGYIYNGLQMPIMKQFNYLGGVWHEEAMNGLMPELQGFEYTVTPSGNAFLAYTNRSDGEFDGMMNLVGFDGINWVNLGQLPVKNIRKVAGINLQTYYEPFKVRFVRNGEHPYILMQRDNNTLAVFTFNGTNLELVADPVSFPSDWTENRNCCIYNNKLVAIGNGNGPVGLMDDKKSIYQLNGNAFTLLKSVDISIATLLGVWSDNDHLWVACEVFSANKGLFYSPVDIIELKH